MIETGVFLAFVFAAGVKIGREVISERAAKAAKRSILASRSPRRAL